MRELLDRPYAHRGLHDGVTRLENSLAAAAAAAEAGLGVEVDVRVSRDGVAIVHHDPTLTRLCGLPYRVADRDAGWLARQRLGGTDERIPTLAEVLATVAGRVPVLLDLKVGIRPGERRALVRAVLRTVGLGRRGDPLAVVSFDALLLRAMGAAAPRVLRGQSVGVPVLPRCRRALTTLAHPIDHGWSATLSSPQFFAMNVDRLPHPAVARWRNRGRPVLGWTVRSVEQLQSLAGQVDNVIVEAAAAAHVAVLRVP